MRNPWTEKQKAIARENRGKLTAAQIGLLVGRSKFAVAAFLERDRGNSYSMGRVCLDCSAIVTNRCKTGRCPACFRKSCEADPAFQAARRAGIQRKWATDPAHRRKMAHIARDNGRRAAQNPEVLARLQARGRELYAQYLSRPEVRAKCADAIRANSFKMTEARIGWCPPERRAEYFYLTTTKRIPARDARAMIEDQIAAEKARAKPRLSPFERQERALARGAALAANDAVPSRYAAEKKWSVG